LRKNRIISFRVREMCRTSEVWHICGLKAWHICALFLLLPGACKNGDDIPANVTFTENIAPIFNANCNICHRPGGNAHFSLATYEDAKKNAGSSAFVVKERIMPPWPADPHYTQFIGQRTLTDREIRTIEKWAAQGAAEGPRDKMPPLPAYPMGSEVGQPDMRIPVQPILLPANSADKFLLVKVPYQLPADTFAALIEFMPGRKNVVHHVNGDMVKYFFEKKKDVFAGEKVAEMVEDTGSLRKAFERLGLPNDDGSYPVLEKSVVNYLPGVYGQRYPEGIGGYILPRKGVFLLNDIHYGFTNKDDILDSSYINIFFSKVPPRRPLQEFQIGTLSSFGNAPVLPDLIIQPNTVKDVYCKWVVPIDMSIVTINPHMHLLGKSFKAYALKPNGDTIRLISIPRWDFSWQYFYTFKKMLKIPKGSIIVAEGVYDNTTNNHSNPFNPPQLVRDQNGSMRAKDEMFQFIVSYLPYQEGDENISLERPLPASPKER
jgi:Copper type II ascorbate-dependent monooxygenase, C-terminal domain